MQTIGHHTCSKDNGEQYVVMHAPFMSPYQPVTKKLPFLGAGYYFWDDNLEMAKFWGDRHYHGKYFILKSDLQIPVDTFLDLVGNRQDMLHIKNLLGKMKEYGFDRPNWTLGASIEAMKKINSKIPDFFPFEVIRAVDNSALDDDKVFFTAGKPNYTNLNPRIVICFLR